MRSLGASTIAALLAERSSTPGLWLLTLEHDDLSAPIRLANNLEDVSCDGNTYTACGFLVYPPEDSEDGTGRARLKIDNVDRALTPSLRLLSGELEATLTLVFPSDLEAREFDNVEVSFNAMRLEAVQYDETTITATLTHGARLNDAYPQHTFSPFDFRAIQ